jgi:frataxin-like iron-binding protein CyaY
MATRRNGLHFDWSDEANGWVLDSDGKSGFVELLNQALVEQGAEALDLE